MGYSTATKKLLDLYPQMRKGLEDSLRRERKATECMHYAPTCVKRTTPKPHRHIFNHTQLIYTYVHKQREDQFRKDHTQGITVTRASQVGERELSL